MDQIFALRSQIFFGKLQKLKLNFDLLFCLATRHQYVLKVAISYYLQFPFNHCALPRPLQSFLFINLAIVSAFEVFICLLIDIASLFKD